MTKEEVLDVLKEMKDTIELYNSLVGTSVFALYPQALAFAIESLSADTDKDKHYVVRESWEWGNRGEAIAKLDELRDEVYNEDSDGYTYAQAIDMAIVSLRADTVSRSQYQGLLNAIGKVYVEVVRCKDCRHYQKVSWAKEMRCVNPYWATARETAETDFCSYGERKKE